MYCGGQPSTRRLREKLHNPTRPEEGCIITVKKSTLVIAPICKALRRKRGIQIIRFDANTAICAQTKSNLTHQYTTGMDDGQGFVKRSII
jgi:hypothetical protein